MVDVPYVEHLQVAENVSWDIPDHYLVEDKEVTKHSQPGIREAKSVTSL